jgi:hypothetical protein
MKCLFVQGPHHNVHRTVGVDMRATSPLLRVDSIEWGGGVWMGVKRKEVTIELRAPVTVVYVWSIMLGF